VKIAKSKDNIAGDLKAKVKQVVGTCKSCGLTVDGKCPKDVEKEIAEGKYDEKIK
jgi:large subunit ribosomal protein L11